MRTPPPARPRVTARDGRASLWPLLCFCVAFAAGLACNRKEQEAAALEPSIVQWLDGPRAPAAVASGAPSTRALPPDGGAGDSRPQAENASDHGQADGVATDQHLAPAPPTSR
jgi:hypothetical protein